MPPTSQWSARSVTGRCGVRLATDVGLPLRLDVAAAISKLSPRQRLAVDCFYFVGLSVDETARVMGCSEGTVKSTLSDARARLKGMLEGDR